MATEREKYSEIDHLFGVCECLEGDKSCFYEKNYDESKEDAVAHAHCISEAIKFVKNNYTPKPAVLGDGELNSELHMAIKQLFIDGIAWGRENPYGTPVPDPSELPTLEKVRGLLTSQVAAAQERADLLARIDEQKRTTLKTYDDGVIAILYRESEGQWIDQDIHLAYLERKLAAQPKEQQGGKDASA